MSNESKVLVVTGASQGLGQGFVTGEISYIDGGRTAGH